jgi:hypothetical protein
VETCGGKVGGGAPREIGRDHDDRGATVVGDIETGSGVARDHGCVARWGVVALESLIDDLYDRARADGRREPREAYAFDALVALAERDETMPTKKRGNKARYLAILRADLPALARGELAAGEVCEIAGIGSVPAAVARELLGEAVVKLVITKGVDVANVTHLGRGATAAQRVALLWSKP